MSTLTPFVIESKCLPPLEGIVFKETYEKEDGTTVDIWSIVLLRYFIASQGDSEEDALNSIDRVLQGTRLINHKYDRDPFSGYKPAPPEYVELYQEAKLIKPVKVVKGYWNAVLDSVKKNNPL